MAETCEGLCDVRSRCDPTHSWHCCHFGVKLIARIGVKLRAGIKCVKCGKKSRTWIPVMNPEGPVSI